MAVTVKIPTQLRTVTGGEGETTVDGKILRDALVRTIHVVDTRLGALASRYEALGPGFVPTGGEGLKTLDAVRGTFEAYEIEPSYDAFEAQVTAGVRG